MKITLTLITIYHINITTDDDDNMTSDDDDNMNTNEVNRKATRSLPAPPDALQQEAEEVDDVQVEVQRGEHVLLRTDGVALVT